MDKPSRRRQATNQDLDRVVYAAEVIVAAFIDAFDRPLPPLCKLHTALIQLEAQELALALSRVMLVTPEIWTTFEDPEPAPPPTPPDPDDDPPFISQWLAELDSWGNGVNG